MRPKIILIALSLLAAALASGCSSNPQGGTAEAPPAPTVAPSAPPATPAGPQVVSASADELRLKAGEDGEAAVRLIIADEYHVNSNTPSDKFFIATELSALAQGGITPGKPAYPKPVTKKFEFWEKPLSVYEGQPVIKLPLSADPSAPKGRRDFRAKVRVQPCNDKECLPPRDVEAIIPVTVE